MKDDEDAGDEVTETPGSELRDLELPPSLFPLWLRLPPAFGTSRWTVDFTLVLAAANMFALTKFFLIGGRVSALAIVLFFSPRGE